MQIMFTRFTPQPSGLSGLGPLGLADTAARARRPGPLRPRGQATGSGGCRSKLHTLL